MFRQFVLPGLYSIFAIISILVMSSVAPQLATKQSIFFLVGLAAFFFTSSLSFARIKQLSGIGYIGVVFLLLLTLLLAHTTRNTARWIQVGNLFSIQPSQLAPIATSLVIAKLARSLNVKKFQNTLKLLVVVFVPAILILIAPDLGTTIVYLASTLSILFLAEVPWKHLGLLFLGAIVVIIFSWFFVLQPYQKERIFSFTGTADSTANYNAQQSMIAVGSGKLIGRGLGQGVQSHLRFLPERQTDFIFASLAEEFGFFGTTIVLFLYTMLIGYIFFIGLRATQLEAQLFAFSSAILLTLQTGVNISMNIGLMPITGITLPLLSYGGSSIISLAILLGINQRIAKENKKKETLHIR